LCITAQLQGQQHWRDTKTDTQAACPIEVQQLARKRSPNRKTETRCWLADAWKCGTWSFPVAVNLP
jgi:hypothetical protein